MRGSTPPNVVGYLLDEARAVLAEAGWNDVETTETQPPRRGLVGPFRVLRQRTADGRIALVISGEGTPDARVGGAAPPAPVSDPRGEDARP